MISDIHSHYLSMINALTEKKFDSNNPEHHLLVLGDLFDRGDFAVEVLEYLYELNQNDKATIILGNHDSFLLDFLEGQKERVHFNIKFNGFGKTLLQLSGLEPDNDNLDEIHTLINERFPNLQSWLESFPYFLEIGDYIFVHGGIDGTKLDWKTNSSRRDFIWSREIKLHRIEGKIVVAGHHRVATIRKQTLDYDLLYKSNPKMFDILYEDGKILIDRFVEVSNELNVLVLEM
ncbi:diadenosine tetraphosphatase [Candidatus Izimaplasma bacterium HR1]|nr:diadenosine tetraphosphatase [Candidatus Izimaplasma bacterium HR1]